jgi:hypothetical protein
MVQLILEAAQGASPCEYLDTCRGTERGELPEGSHPFRTDGFLPGAAFAAIARASAQPMATALLQIKIHSAIFSFQVRCGIKGV